MSSSTAPDRASAWHRQWQALDPRVRALLAAALLAFVLFEVWVLLLRPPWQQWRLAREAVHQAQANQLPSLTLEIEQARQRLQALKTEQDALQAQSAPESLSAWSDSVRQAARSHRVQVLNLTPGAGPLATLQVEALLPWSELLPWLEDLGRGPEASALTVLRVQVQAAGSPLGVQLQLVRAGVSLESTAMEAARPWGRSTTMAPKTLQAVAAVAWGAPQKGGPANPERADPDQPPQVRSVLVAGTRSMVQVGERLVEMNELVDGYRLIEVHEDRAIFVRQGKRLTVKTAP